jgi:hypothetical protein
MAITGEPRTIFARVAESVKQRAAQHPRNESKWRATKPHVFRTSHCKALGGVRVVQDAAADVEDHGPVPAEECGEGIVTTTGEKVGEKFFVRRRRGGQPADVLYEDGVFRHGVTLARGRVRLSP